MHKPNPWILLMGGFALLNVAAMTYGTKTLPHWGRVAGGVIFVVMGIMSLALGLHHQFKKKPTLPPKRAKIPAKASVPSGTPKARASGDTPGPG